MSSKNLAARRSPSHLQARQQRRAGASALQTTAVPDTINVVKQRLEKESSTIKSTIQNEPSSTASRYASPPVNPTVCSVLPETLVSEASTTGDPVVPPTGQRIDNSSSREVSTLFGTSATTEDENEENSSHPSHKASTSLPTLRLSIRAKANDGRVKQIKETDDLVEVCDENESGLSWGYKRAKDGTWEEQWLQQSSQRRMDGGESNALGGEAQDLTVVFGQSSGINGRLHQRWSAAWESDTQREPASSPDRNVTNSHQHLTNRTVKKSVRQYKQDMETLEEEWDEEIHESSRLLSEALEDTTDEPWTRRIRTIKTGTDKVTGRRWRTVVSERFKQSVDGESLLDRAESFEETKDTTSRSRESRTQSDGSEITSIHMETMDGGRLVIVDEEQCQNEEGTKWGKKSGTTADNETWESSWIERLNGQREVVEWKRVDNCTRGEKNSRSSDGATYNERWEVTLHPCSNEHNILTETRFTDRWWTGANGHRWGEKDLITKDIKDEKRSKTVIGTPDEEGTEESKQLKSSHIVREKWYDNCVEKVVDNWKVDKEFDSNEEDGTLRVVRLVKHGYKVGDRYSDGTQWGEHWGRVYEPASWKKLHQEDDTEDSNGVELEVIMARRSASSASLPHGEESLDDEVTGSENPVDGDGVVLRIRHHDRWWIESSGNKWGEKRYADLKLNEERNENWYNNCTEEQVDRWEINEDGTRQGVKFGKALDGSKEWKERWKGTSEEENFWIDKYWSEHQEGGRRLRWGEIEGKEGGKKWRQRWGEDKNVEYDDGRKWTEKWDDDGFGNVTTLKEGEDWVGGRNVNWFSDKYGECLGKGEKWAVKQGTTSEGDVWMEKWNELQGGEKRAEKVGRNRFGDEWYEAWKEQLDGEKRITWAEKTGKNLSGDEWLETWREEGDGKKFAKKIGKNDSEEWTEQWGEELNPDGSGQKWTSKWARNRQTGDAQGQSWGDDWGTGGKGGHHWGDKWHNEQVDKWWKDTSGRPEGC